MWMLAVIVGCGVVPEAPPCGDFLPLEAEARQWDYDLTGLDETLTAGPSWDAGEDAWGYALDWSLLRNPDPPEVEDRSPNGAMHDFTWNIVCAADGTVTVQDFTATGEDWVDDGDHVPWSWSESYEPPIEIWLAPEARGSGWTGSTAVTCTDTDGDCSRDLDWDIVLDAPGPILIGNTTRERVGMTGTNFPWAPFERVELIEGRAIWSFQMLGGQEWVLDGISDAGQSDQSR